VIDIDMLFSFFLPRTERRPFNPERESIVRLCTATRLLFFFTCLISRCDSYNVLLLFKTAINQRAFNDGKEGGGGFKRTPRLSRYFSRRLERLNRKNEIDEWRTVARKTEHYLALTEINTQDCCTRKHLSRFLRSGRTPNAPCVRVPNQSNYPPTLSRVTFRAGYPAASVNRDPRLLT